MKITYINHSGFLVETENCYYVFDYYKGEMPMLDISKEVVVFCSHFHQDHFNLKIFEILDDMGMNYQAVLAKDISKKKYPDGVKVTTAYHDQTYILDNGTQVSTLLSTDSGVAFIVKTSEGMIYHAGDLNDWHRQEEHYADGMLYFLKHVDCSAVFPMHYWNEPSVIDRFTTEYPQYKSRIKNTESAKGEEI